MRGEFQLVTLHHHSKPLSVLGLQYFFLTMFLLQSFLDPHVSKNFILMISYFHKTSLTSGGNGWLRLQYEAYSSINFTCNQHALLFYTNLHGLHLISSIAILKTCLSVKRELLYILLLQVQLKRIIRDNKTWGEKNTGTKAERYFLLTFILVLLKLFTFLAWQTVRTVLPTVAMI